MRMAPGDLVAGRYRLMAPLGQGGMGQVWEARHERLDAVVAVKFIKHELMASDTARTRFEREAKAAASIRSPHVVQILDYGMTEADVPFLVMERLRGEDLRHYMARCGQLELLDAAKIVLQACKALQLSSDAGIVHRDLKPANIFLSVVGNEVAVKLLDFGIAKAKTLELSEESTTGQAIGSPHFMSPEQLRGRAVTTASDAWSLAVVAWTMLVGRRPYEGDDFGELVVNVMLDKRPKLGDLSTDWSPALDTFFDRALAGEPEARFPSPMDMAEALRVVVAEVRLDASIDAPLVLPVVDSSCEAVLPRDQPTMAGGAQPIAEAAEAPTVVPAAPGEGTAPRPAIDSVSSLSLSPSLASPRAKNRRAVLALGVLAVAAVVAAAVVFQPASGSVATSNLVSSLGVPAAAGSHAVDSASPPRAPAASATLAAPSDAAAPSASAASSVTGDTAKPAPGARQPPQLVPASPTRPRPAPVDPDVPNPTVGY